MKFSTVKEALDLLGVGDHENVATVVITPQHVTVTRYPVPRALDQAGDITTETEVIEIEY